MKKLNEVMERFFHTESWSSLISCVLIMIVSVLGIVCLWYPWAPGKIDPWIRLHLPWLLTDSAELIVDIFATIVMLGLFFICCLVIYIDFFKKTKKINNNKNPLSRTP